MKRITKLVYVIAGIVLAIISHQFFEGWLNIIPWTIVALLIGYFSSSKMGAVFNGALFGYFLFITYILIGYQGNSDKAGIIKIFFSLPYLI